MAAPLANPERDWERPAATRVLDRAALRALVAERLGACDGEPVLLGGGLANLNVRVGGGRVLRVYRRDPAARPREEALLRREWSSFVVPRVLGSGPDFLLLEEVAHEPLRDRAAEGALLGRALAEIHVRRYERAGELDARLELREPYPDAFAPLRGHALACVERACVAAADRSLEGELRRFLDDNEERYRRSARDSVLLHADFKVSNLHRTPAGALLVLDWEFAWAGPPLLDVGQLFRWGATEELARAFAESYRAGGGSLPEEWRRRASELDLCNLAGLVERAEPASRRARDVVALMRSVIQGTSTPR